MFSRAVSRGVRGVPSMAAAVRVSQLGRTVNATVGTNIPQMVVQKREFGKFSNFAAAFKEEYEKAKKEAAEKAGAESEAVDKKVEEEVTTESNAEKATEEAVNTTAEQSAEEAAKKAEKEAARAAKREAAEKAAKEASDKVKAKMDESTQKLKESWGSASQEAKEQLQEQSKKLGSFWNDFSSEMKKEFNIGANKPVDPKKAAKKAGRKAAKQAMKKAEQKKKKPASPSTQTNVNAAAGSAAGAEGTGSTESTEGAETPASTPSSAEGIESLQDLEAQVNADVEEEEEVDPMSDEALGITPEMTEEEADEIRKEAKRRQIKAENYEKKKGMVRETWKKSVERAKVKTRSITWDGVKHFLRDGWNDIKGSNAKPHRVLLDEDEVEKQRQEILQAREAADKMKEEAEKTGEKLKTDLMKVDNSNNLWAQVADLLKDAPLIESLLEMSRKVKESKVGETVTYATEDFREKWETSQHPLVYKLSAVYDELFSESETARAIKEVRRTDPTFLEDALRDEMKNRIVPAMLNAWVNADTKTLKLVMNDHAYAQVYSVIKMQQAEGLEMDKTILDIRDVQLESAHVMERQSPAFLYLVTVQMVNCIRDREGNIVQGKEDEIKQMYYYMALQQEHDDELNIMRWKIVEMQLVGELDTW